MDNKRDVRKRLGVFITRSSLGAFVKGALRFDFGRYNELIQALQIGLSLDAYSKKIEIMAPKDARGAEAVNPKNLFFQGHIAFVFGRRK